VLNSQLAWFEINMANSCRISFDYAVRRNKETRFEELPFVICVIANFSGTKERSVNAPRASRFIRVAPHSLKDVFRSVGPSLHVEFGEPVCAGKRCEELSIDFRSLEDFAPQRIASLLYEQYAASDFIDVSAAPPPGVPDYLKQRVDEILHNPSFKNLHSTWLGVDMLLKTVASPSLQVLMLDI
jgi:type VI secretion system ImpB/VipA family protein